MIAQKKFVRLMTDFKDYYTKLIRLPHKTPEQQEAYNYIHAICNRPTRLFVEALSGLFPKQITILDEGAGKSVDIFVWWIYMTEFGAKNATYTYKGRKYRLTTAAKLYSFMKEMCEEI